MNIALVTSSFPARSETFIVEHAVGLARRGHSVTVISGPSGADIRSEEIESIRKFVQIENSGHLIGGEITRAVHLIKKILVLDTIGFRKKLTLLNLIRKIKVPGRLKFIHSLLPIVGKKYDVVHVHYGFLAVPVALLRKAGLVQGKVVVTWHGYDANQIPLMYGDTIYRNIFLDRVVHTVGSKFMWKRLLSLGAHERYLKLVAMGIDLEFFRVEPKGGDSLSPLKILSVGRLVEEKGFEFLISAMHQLVQQGKEVELVIIGEGDCRPHLESLIVELALEDKVILKGAQDRYYVRNTMWNSHIFALPGVHAKNGSVESQGVVFAEAQGCGMPVIASEVGGVPESVLDGETGILCDPRSVEQIVSAILHFVENPEDIGKYGNAARRHVELNFSNQMMLQSFERIYIDIV